MKILAITTSSSNCSVAILEDKNLLKELHINDAKTHSETLMPLIKQILNETNLTLNDINYLACDIGPGSFTGIRIGVSTIKAISENKNIPICPIPSLEGLAYLAENNKGLTVSLIDARNNQAYFGVYNEDFTLNEDLSADSIENIITLLKTKNANFNFVGSGAKAYKDLLLNNFKDASFALNDTLSASLIGKVAYAKILKNILVNADALMPLYLRKSQAERMKELSAEN